MIDYLYSGGICFVVGNKHHRLFESIILAPEMGPFMKDCHGITWIFQCAMLISRLPRVH